MPAIPQIPSRPTLCACTRIRRPSQVSPPPADVPPPGHALTGVWQTSGRPAIATPVDAGRSRGGRATGRHQHPDIAASTRESDCPLPPTLPIWNDAGGLLGATVTSPLSPLRQSGRYFCSRPRRTAGPARARGCFWGEAVITSPQRSERPTAASGHRQSRIRAGPTCSHGDESGSQPADDAGLANRQQQDAPCHAGRDTRTLAARWTRSPDLRIVAKAVASFSGAHLTNAIVATAQRRPWISPVAGLATRCAEFKICLCDPVRRRCPSYRLPRPRRRLERGRRRLLVVPLRM